MRSLKLSAAALAVAALLAACGGAGPSEAVTIRLLTHDSFAVSQPLIDAFEAETGIKLQVVRAGDAGTMVAGAILAAGNPTADVIYGFDNTMTGNVLAGDIFEPYRARANWLPELAGLTANGTIAPIDYGDVCVNIDDGYFAERGLKPPANLADLAKPAYRGLLVVQDPAASSPGMAFLLATRAEFGDGWLSYWEKLRANEVKVAGSWSDAYYADFTKGGGNGRYPLVVSYATSPPAEIVYAEEPKPTTVSTSVMTAGCFRQVEFAGVLRGTKHSAEARKVVDWLLSPAVQADIPLSMFVFPAVADTPLPDVFVKFAGAAVDPYTVNGDEYLAESAKWLAAWDSVMNN